MGQRSCGRILFRGVILAHRARISAFEFLCGQFDTWAYTSAHGKGGYVYILSSKGRRLYAGVTSRLRVRVQEHKKKVHPSCFTARHNIDRLVYYRGFETIGEAIARETQIKNMHRIQKIQLITALNPTWRDLSEDWGKPIPTFDESKMRPAVSFPKR